MSGSLDPKKECRSVDSPDTISMLEMTLAVSSCKKLKKSDDESTFQVVCKLKRLIESNRAFN